MIREEPTTLATLQNACHDVNGRWYSLQTICWGLDEFEFSFKCITLVDEHSETPENLARRAAYARDFATRLCVNQTTVFYMDEVGFNLSMRRPYGYSPRGTRAVTMVPHIRSKNLTVMALVGLPQGAPPSKVMVCCYSLILTVHTTFHMTLSLTDLETVALHW